MLTIELGTFEYFDSNTNEFIVEKGGLANFEYTLKVVYDWEAKYKKPFLKNEYKDEELLDFFHMMALEPFEDRFLQEPQMKQLIDYIQDGQTATTFSAGPAGEKQVKGRGKIYTAEELYAIMFQAGVDISFEHRNLNRLLVVLRIIGSHNNPPKKMSKNDILRQNANLNAQRKAQLKTKG